MGPARAGHRQAGGVHTMSIHEAHTAPDPSPRARRWQWLAAAGAHRAILVAVRAWLAVAADTVVLVAGVIWRHVLRTRLVRSDELAAMVFLWLAMLGSVVALQRG